jgi:hypothetical protein
LLRARKIVAFWLPLVCLGLVGCSEPKCNPGMEKVGSRCRNIGAADPSDGGGGVADASDNGATGDAATTGNNATTGADHPDANAANGSSDAGGNTAANSGAPTGTCSAELCNGEDDDCDSIVDEGCPQVDDCAAMPCKNGGICTDGEDTFTCACQPGYSGATCEEDVDDCAPNPCQNGGTCSDAVNGYSCTCHNGFSGPKCETKVCGTLSLLSRADIDMNRACTEIQGDLSIGVKGFGSLTSTDFPNLTKVAGNLTIGSQFVGGDGVDVETVVFGALKSVGGTLSIGPLQATSPRTNISFLALESLGGNAENALSVSFSPVRSLLTPALRTIQGNVVFSAADELCSVNFRSVTSVTGSVTLSTPLLFYADIQPLIAASQVSPVLSSYDCCVANTTTCGFEPPPAPMDTVCRCR